MHEPENSKSCHGPFFCNRPRTCERCAKKRQAYWADKAEHLEHNHGQLLLARIKPEFNNAHALRAARDKIARRALAPNGIWSVETGSLFAGLHLNILTPADTSRLERIKPDYSELVRCSARDAAAYIFKPQGMPPPSQYSGKLGGQWGTLSELIGKSKDLNTACARAALINLTLMPPAERAKLPGARIEIDANHDHSANASLIEWLKKTESEKSDYSPAYRDAMEFAASQHAVVVSRSNAEYKIIAERNLSALYTAMGKTRP
jgi:hypothetical protein